MKMLQSSLLCTALLLGADAGAQILTETYNFTVGSPSGIVSDQGIPLTLSQTISASEIHSLTEVGVTLHLRGISSGAGWAGDMFVSLNRNGQETSILLNQVGVVDENTTEGFSFDGWNVSFRDSAANGDVHLGEPTTPATILTGEWQPDGRQNALDTLRPGMLSVFNGADPNTTWHITLADLNMDGQMVLESWSMTFSGTAVPEPSTWAAFTAVGLGAFAAVRRRGKK